MKRIQCPIPHEELRHLYLEEKLTDEAIVEYLGKCATLKRVRSWRHHFGIETIGRTDRHEVLPIEGRLRSILVGSMLGDGRLSRTVNASRYQENHSEAQKKYLGWKLSEWGVWVKEPMKPVIWHTEAGDFPGWRFHTVSHQSLNKWQTLFYDESGPKRLDAKIKDYVDALALAVWFLDDGSAQWWPHITFGMNARSLEIAYEIFAKFSLKPRWAPRKGNTGDFIFEGEDQAHLFISLVKPHMPECMQYKLNFGFQGAHYQVRKALPEELLREMASRGVPIRRMAKELGQSHTTIDRYLQEFGIPHPRTMGRPSQT
jgi:hypothetical protein